MYCHLIHFTTLCLLLLSTLCSSQSPEDNKNIISFITDNRRWTVSKDRIVTDYTVLSSPTGVPIDFSYNETAQSGVLTSSPGCPKSIEGHPWIYYGDPARCFLAGFQGPCTDTNRVLLVERYSLVGICGCKCLLNFQKTIQQREILEDTLYFSSNSRYQICPGLAQEQAYDKENKKCYNFGEQGPCEKNQWFVKDRSGLSAICVPACFNNTSSTDKPNDTSLVYDWELGRCVLGSKRFGASFIPNNTQYKCSEEERYSKVLKKCVAKSKLKKGLVLG